MRLHPEFESCPPQHPWVLGRLLNLLSIVWVMGAGGVPGARLGRGAGRQAPVLPYQGAICFPPPSPGLPCMFTPVFGIYSFVLLEIYVFSILFQIETVWLFCYTLFFFWEFCFLSWVYWDVTHIQWKLPHILANVSLGTIPAVRAKTSPPSQSPSCSLSGPDPLATERPVWGWHLWHCLCSTEPRPCDEGQTGPGFIWVLEGASDSRWCRGLAPGWGGDPTGRLFLSSVLFPVRPLGSPGTRLIWKSFCSLTLF